MRISNNLSIDYFFLSYSKTLINDILFYQRSSESYFILILYRFFSF